MSEAKTVSASTSTDLFVEQTKDVANMRNALLKFDKRDPNAARKALQNVTILRVYHQLERIVRYTDLIDRIEDKYYQSIDMYLETADPDDTTLWQTLIPMQERLQELMIQSHKLLEPYLKMEQLTALDVPQETDPSESFTSMLLDQESREKVRTGVQELMAIMNTLDSTSKDVSNEAASAVQSKAAEALSELVPLEEGDEANA